MNATIEIGTMTPGLEVPQRESAPATDFPPVDHNNNPACSNSASDGGARPDGRAPSASFADPAINPFPRGRWTSSVKAVRQQLPPLTGVLEAPLRELFWTPPETSMVEDATQRIANLLQSAANAVQEIQLFDDVYEVPAC
jgi:hypothetical protein